jgi:hypothetical protein
MSSIGKVTEEIINRSPFLRESLTENLINVSALARKIKPEIEDILKKPVKEGAVIMAIKRMSPGYYHRINLNIKNFMGTLGDFLVRSDLEDFTFENSATLTLKQAEMMKSLNDTQDPFYTFCHGVGESTIITSVSVTEELEKIFQGEKLKSHTPDLASITIKLPTVNTEISGIYYYILKHLAWEGINIVEVVSTSNEFTVVVHSDDIDAAFSVLMQLKKEGKKVSTNN